MRDITEVIAWFFVAFAFLFIALHTVAWIIRSVAP